MKKYLKTALGFLLACAMVGAVVPSVSAGAETVSSEEASLNFLTAATKKQYVERLAFTENGLEAKTRKNTNKRSWLGFDIPVNVTEETFSIKFKTPLFESDSKNYIDEGYTRKNTYLVVESLENGNAVMPLPTGFP